MKMKPEMIHQTILEIQQKTMPSRKTAPVFIRESRRTPVRLSTTAPSLRFAARTASINRGLPQPPKALLSALFMALLFAAMLLSRPAWSQLVDNRVTELTALDRHYMNTQRELATELTLRHFGARCCRSVAELDYLQRLLDQRIVHAEQTRELQAMGVVLGDLLAKELDLHWVVYEDINGRSRALQLDNTENFLFPVTMIARRKEANDNTPVRQIYQTAFDTMQAARPPLPFQ
ncbi:MAG: DUF3806 domain-containing protein [Congregibacter sp.]